MPPPTLSLSLFLGRVAVVADFDEGDCGDAWTEDISSGVVFVGMFIEFMTQLNEVGSGVQ